MKNLSDTMKMALWDSFLLCLGGIFLLFMSISSTILGIVKFSSISGIGGIFLGCMCLGGSLMFFILYKQEKKGAIILREEEQK